MPTPPPAKVSKNQRVRGVVAQKKSLCPKGHEIIRALYDKGGKRKFIWFCECDQS